MRALILILLSVFLVSGFAYASQHERYSDQNYSDFYIVGRGGYSIMSDTAYYTGLSSVKTNYKSGFTFSGAVGYEFSMRDSYFTPRAELEFAHSINAVKKHDFFVADDTSGEAHISAIMANGYIDVHVTDKVDFIFGAGLGGANVVLNDFFSSNDYADIEGHSFFCPIVIGNVS